MSCQRILFALVLLLVGWSGAAAQEPPVPHDESAVAAAEQLMAATVTVRVQPGKVTLDKQPSGNFLVKRIAEPESSRAVELPSDVTVCSGVCVQQGLIVTFASAPAAARFRITLPDGAQAEADLRVIDEYSGLTLLQIDEAELTALAMATIEPAVGSVVLTAAAAGIEPPTVSRGIVGGVRRSLAGSDLPALLQCDVRTTATSSGAAVVDPAGQLLGIVAATGTQELSGDWTFAIPSSHIARLLAARVPDELVILERQRPSIGLMLAAGPGEGTVRIERVLPGGPGDLAGMKVGDTIVSADGRKIRSAYQVVDLVMKKQPGEVIELVVQPQGGGDAGQQSVRITLAGALEPRFANTTGTDRHIGPQLKVRMTRGSDADEANQPSITRQGKVVAVQTDGVAAIEVAPADGADSTQTTLARLQQRVLELEAVIARLEVELSRGAARQAETQRLLRQLAEQVTALRENAPAAE